MIPAADRALQPGTTPTRRGRKYGDASELAEAVGYPVQYLKDLGTVARAFGMSFRNDNLTFTHYR